MRYISVFAFAALLFFFSFHISFAESNYVLPYPSFMPGSIFYKIHLVLENGEKYWYFGNFGQFTYNLKQSDKYLVEAKTLFEYKQYLLANKALDKSNTHFVKAYQFLGKAKLGEKNISQKELLLKEASEKHIEIFKTVKSQVPESFIWMPKKESPNKLLLWRKIDEAISIRKSCI